MANPADRPNQQAPLSDLQTAIWFAEQGYHLQPAHRDLLVAAAKEIVQQGKDNAVVRGHMTPVQ